MSGTHYKAEYMSSSNRNGNDSEVFKKCDNTWIIVIYSRPEFMENHNYAHEIEPTHYSAHALLVQIHIQSMK